MGASVQRFRTSLTYALASNAVHPRIDPIRLDSALCCPGCRRLCLPPQQLENAVQHAAVNVVCGP
jgi:hypothetical protein